MIPYFIKSTICLITLYGFYHFVLRHHKILMFNRFYLIFSLVFSITVPLIEIPVNSSFPLTNSVNELTITPEYPVGSRQLMNNADTSYSDLNILPLLFIAFSTCFFIRFAFNLFIIIRKAMKCKKIEMNNLSLVLVEEKTLPHSFFKYIFVNKSDYEDGKIEKELLIHEEAHCLQYHSVDIILIELLKVFFWFNPFIWLFKKEILLNHEYYADNKVLENNEATDYYKLLVNLVIQSNTSYLASNFKYTAIKNRLIMMTKDKPFHNAISSKISAIPLFLIIGINLTFCQQVSQKANMIDFSGKWVLSHTKGETFLTDVANSIIVISQKDNSVNMEVNITPNDDNAINRTEKYVFGKSVRSKNTKGDMSTVITCTPAPDGKSFSITELLSYKQNGTEKKAKRVSVYSLTVDGAALIIKVYDNVPEGSSMTEDEILETRVYDKVQ
jgi:hypothetical protein